MKPKLFQKLAAIGIGLSIAWIFSEIFLSVWWDNYWFRSGRSIKLKEHTPNITRVYKREGISKNIGGKISFRTDKDGFILPNLMENSSANSEHFTIAFLGGSTTECLIVKEDLRFPVLVGKSLKKRLGKDIFVINAGCAGDTTHDSINSLFNKVMNYKPDIAVMMHAVNDAGLLLNKGDYKERMIQESDNSFRSIIRILTTKSNLLGFLRNSYAQFSINREVIANANRLNNRVTKTAESAKFTDLENAVSQFESRLKIFVDMCNDFGVTAVLMTQPFMNKPDRELNEYEGRTFLSGMKFLEPFNDEIRKVSAEKAVLIIDLEREIPKIDKYFYDEVHFTDDGSILVSDIITRDILKILKK